MPNVGQTINKPICSDFKIVLDFLSEMEQNLNLSRITLAFCQNLTQYRVNQKSDYNCYLRTQKM